MERETERQRGRGLEHLRTLPQSGWPRAHSPSSIPPLTREALPSQAPLCDYLAQGSGMLILTSECLPPLRLTQAWGREGGWQARLMIVRPRTRQDTAPMGRVQPASCLKQEVMRREPEQVVWGKVCQEG